MKNNNSNHHHNNKLFLTGLILTGAFVISVGYSNNAHANERTVREGSSLLDPLTKIVSTLIEIIGPTNLTNVVPFNSAQPDDIAAAYSTSGATGAPISSQFASGPATGAASASQAASQAIPVIG